MKPTGTQKGDMCNGGVTLLLRNDKERGGRAVYCMERADARTFQTDGRSTSLNDYLDTIAEPVPVRRKNPSVSDWNNPDHGPGSHMVCITLKERNMNIQRQRQNGAQKRAKESA